MSKAIPVEVSVRGLIKVDRNECWVSSVDMAATFGKNHRDVIRAIREEIGDETGLLTESHCATLRSEIVVSPSKSGSPKTSFEDPKMAHKAKAKSQEFNAKHFRETTYVNERGQTWPMYMMSEEGFTSIAMKFTGAKAKYFRQMFVDEFYRMRRELTRIMLQQSDRDWQQARLEGKVQHRELTDTVKDILITYAKSFPESKHPEMFYVSLAKLAKNTLFEKDEMGKPPIREQLTTKQLRHLAMVEELIVYAIIEVINIGAHYKDCYKLAKARVEEFVLRIGGKSVPGENRQPLLSLAQGATPMLTA